MALRNAYLAASVTHAEKSALVTDYTALVAKDDLETQVGGKAWLTLAKKKKLELKTDALAVQAMVLAQQGYIT